jgi:hypothetical protein
MLRHLRNSQELVLYASLSAGAAFLGRILPPFYFPILLLRLGIFAYCFFIIVKAEGNKELGIVLGSAICLGMLGGYWDLIEIYLRYDLQRIITTVTAVVVFLVIGTLVTLQVQGNGRLNK